MNSTSGSRKSVADDEFKRRAMDAYQAKGKSATMNAASSMKARSASTRHAMRDRSDSESSLSSESEMSDSDSDASGASPRGRGRRRRGRHRDDSLSSESDGEDKRQVRAKPLDAQVAKVVPVELHGARVGIVKPEKEVNEGAFAGAGRTGSINCKHGRSHVYKL